MTDKTSSEWDLSEEEEEVDMCASDEGIPLGSSETRAWSTAHTDFVLSKEDT